MICSRKRYSYHRIGKSSRNSNQHPPHNPHQKLLAVTLDECLDNGAIHRRDFNTDQCSDDQKEAMADQQARLGAPPARHRNLHEPQQAAKELAVELDLLFLGSHVLSLAATRGAASLFALCSLAARRSLLFGNGIAYAVDEGDEEGEVDGARDSGAVGQVEICQLGHDGPDGTLLLAQGRLGEGMKGGELGLRGHGGLVAVLVAVAVASAGCLSARAMNSVPKEFVQSIVFRQSRGR